MSAATRAALSVRVSGQEQAERGSIDTQTEFLQGYCSLNGLEIVDIYKDEGISGTIPFPQRPDSARLLRDAARGKFDLVVSYKLDRIGRSVKVVYDALQMLEELGVGYRSATESLDTTSPFGRVMLGLMAVFAQWERDLITERSHEGRKRVARQGKWPAGPSPWGYRRDKATGLLQIDDEPIPGCDLSEAQVVREVFRLIVEDKRSLYYVVQWLQEERVPSYRQTRGVNRGPGYWSHTAVQILIHNPVYKGQQVYGKKRGDDAIRAEVPAIISPAIWEAAQQQVTANQKCSKRNSKRVYLLSGMLFCAACGHRFVGLTQQGRWSYYVCNSKNGKNRPPDQPACPSHSFSAPALEREIWESILEYLQHPDETLQALVDQLNEDQDDVLPLQEEIDHLTSLIHRLQRQRDRTIHLFVRGQIKEEEKDSLLAEIDADQARFEVTRAERANRLTAIQNRQKQLTLARQLLQQRHRTVEVATDEQKQAIMQQAVREVIVFDDHLDVNLIFSPDPQLLAVNGSTRTCG